MDADELLCRCIYLYMKKRGWQSSAETFRKECGISEDDVGIDHVFVDTMWSNFHRMCAYVARTHNPRIVQSMQQCQPSTSYGNVTMPRKITSLEGISLHKVSVDSLARPVSVCDFSSDGGLLVGASSTYGDITIECDSKVLIWNTQTFDCVTIPNAHHDYISEVRFKPGSTIFASSSYDGTIKIWDAANILGSYEPFALLRHGGWLHSLDFHPTEDILWCCDCADTIHVWNVNDRFIIKTFPGGADKLRFQPPLGKLLAAGSGNNINIFDVNTFSVLATLRTLELWIPETGERLAIPAHTLKVEGLAT